ncbi:MAG: 3-oxoacyl-[acyl-carrier-protein] reductase [Nitrospinota bacterium]|nr:3-oxoacyl-[acyl-carrier-protein] reductase [Nitrospinota bacterium]
MGRLSGKAALITGASRGIGQAIALAYAREGADLYLVSRSTPLDSVLAECRALGVRADGGLYDVAAPEEAKKAVEACVAAFGKIDALVNNAGITKDGLLVRMKDDDFSEVIRVNLGGCFNMTRAAAKPMMKNRAGRIVNITSVVGAMGNAGQANYAASKAGIVGMTKSVAKELGSRGVTANSVAPGFVETDMTKVLTDENRQTLLKSIPLGRFGSVEDVAGAAVFLASDEAAYVTGITLFVDGGMAMG